MDNINKSDEYSSQFNSDFMDRYQPDYSPPSYKPSEEDLTIVQGGEHSAEMARMFQQAAHELENFAENSTLSEINRDALHVSFDPEIEQLREPKNPPPTVERRRSTRIREIQGRREASNSPATPRVSRRTFTPTRKRKSSRTPSRRRATITPSGKSTPRSRSKSSSSSKTARNRSKSRSSSGRNLTPAKRSKA